VSESGSKKKLIVTLIILISIIAIVPSRWKNDFKMRSIRFISPVLKYFNDKTSKLAETLSVAFQFNAVKKENDDLRERIKIIKDELVHLKEKELENSRLRTILKLKKRLDQHKFVAASVIARDATNWYKSIIIDKGSEDGVSRNDPVLSPGGVVGSVFECGRNESKVFLIIENNSRMGVIVQRTRDIGVIEGQPDGELFLHYIPRTSDIKAGDKLISSGLGRIYPKGISVGEIIKVSDEKFKLYKFAEVKPSVDFRKLEEVLVIIKRGADEEEVSGEQAVPENVEKESAKDNSAP